MSLLTRSFSAYLSCRVVNKMLFQGDLVYAGGCVDMDSPCFHETKSLTDEDSLVVNAVLIPNITK